MNPYKNRQNLTRLSTWWVYFFCDIFQGVVCGISKGWFVANAGPASQTLDQHWVNVCRKMCAQCPDWGSQMAFSAETGYVHWESRVEGEAARGILWRQKDVGQSRDSSLTQIPALRPLLSWWGEWLGTFTPSRGVHQFEAFALQLQVHALHVSCVISCL